MKPRISAMHTASSSRSPSPYARPASHDRCRRAPTRRPPAARCRTSRISPEQYQHGESVVTMVVCLQPRSRPATRKATVSACIEGSPSCTRRLSSRPQQLAVRAEESRPDRDAALGQTQPPLLQRHRQHHLHHCVCRHGTTTFKIRTRRPVATAGAVWAAHPPSAFARDRHRRRANTPTPPPPRLSPRSARVGLPAPDYTATEGPSSVLTPVKGAAGNPGREGTHRCIGRPVAASVRQYVS
jgi:hypothetical protein